MCEQIKIAKNIIMNGDVIMEIKLLKVDSDGLIWCDTDMGVGLYIRSYNKGVLTIEPDNFVSIEKFAKMVSTCFYPYSKLRGIKRIKFTFNDVPISVSAEKSTPYMIVKQYEDKRTRN